MTNNVVIFPGTYHSDRKPATKAEPRPYRCVVKGCKSIEMRVWDDGAISCSECGEVSPILRCYVSEVGFDDGA